MNTIRLSFNRVEMEKVMITLGMALMEASGVVLLVCGLLDIKIF